jgi:ABC-type amino acid transport system permease subunit
VKGAFQPTLVPPASPPSLWRDPRARSFLLQALFAAAVVAVVAFVAWNTAANLNRYNIRVGLAGRLRHPAATDPLQ